MNNSFNLYGNNDHSVQSTDQTASQAQFLRQILQQSTQYSHQERSTTPTIEKRQRDRSSLGSAAPENASCDNSPLRTTRKPFGYKAQPSQSIKPVTSTSESNFKVVVRVRPPLQRELLPDGVNCCSVVSVHNANEDCVAKDVILHEYLGMAVDEQHQMLDMQKNP